MNRKLTTEQIISTFQQLQATEGTVSGRALRAALRQRFGAAGKTARIFALCRSLQRPKIDEAALVLELRQRQQEAERAKLEAQAARDQALERAMRAEAREVSHQDHWAREVDQLRQLVQQLSGEAARRQALDLEVLRLHRELQALRARLALLEK